MADGREGSAGTGRGRGRAKFTETKPPGAAAPPRPAEQSSTGPSSTTPPEKRSPTDSGSPGETDKMAALEIASLSSRPGFGQAGRKYRVFANHFEIRLADKALTVNHYHIEISHPVASVKLKHDENRPILWNCLLKNAQQLNLSGRDDLHKAAYDGVSNLYTLNPLTLPRENLIRLEVELLIPKFDKVAKFTVLIQAVGPVLVDLRQVAAMSGPQQLTPIQIIDIIIRQYRSNPLMDLAKCFYPFQNSVYMVPGTQDAPGGIDLGAGREIWKGLFTSVRIGQDFKTFVNMDVAHTAFFKMGSNGNGNGNGGHYTCIQFLCDVLNAEDAARGGRGQTFSPAQIRADTSINDIMRKNFEKEIKSRKICIDYNRPNAGNPNREYQVYAVDRPATQITFAKDDVTKTVAEYFGETYGPLRFPNMPTLKVGSKARPIFLPIEHCYLAPRQKSAKKLTEAMTATMIRQTCMAPFDRKRSIEHMVHLARFTNDPFLKAFGIQINPKMTEIDSRVIPPPGVTYAANSPAQLRDGVWRANNMKFHLPAQAVGVAAIAFGTAPNNAQAFVNSLLQTCVQCGMQMPRSNEVYFHLESDKSSERVEIGMKAVVNAMKQHNIGLSLVIAFVPVKGSPLYPEIKRVAEVNMGIMTQCVTNKTVQKFSPDTLSNIVFKINMKLGGINCQLATRDAVGRCLFSEPTLLLGIDVTHPGPTDKTSPSIASVVGSMDKTYMRYAASIKVQKQRRESLVYLSDPVSDRLMYFYKATKVKPSRIIVYRDGVSEGEFKTVLREELRGIRESALKMDANYRPKITFVVVQKRHHTRLFPGDPNDGCGKAKNVYPGTVVDTNILYHEDFNFYLCSHAGIQGTSRPTRYHVLYDDNNFSADELQMMTYYLCHCFSRCTRAVSIPAPVYYAHLACTRSKHHLQQLLSTSSDTASNRSGGQEPSSSISEDDLIRGATVDESIRKEMYFT